MTTILMLWQVLRSKATIYGLAALAIVIALLKAFSAGGTKEKLSQAQATIKENKRNAEIAATIDSTSTSVIRDRLRNDWSSK